MPSIAVLPFANMSSDSEQEYFADGMVEEIITALSRIRWLFVIARNSSFTYKGKATDVKQVGANSASATFSKARCERAGTECGSPRSWSMRLTVHISGPSASTARSKTCSTCRIRSRISVAGVIEPTLRQTEIERARRKRPESLDAYDLYLRALPFAYTAMPEDARQGARFSSGRSSWSPILLLPKRSLRGVRSNATCGAASASRQKRLRCVMRAWRLPWVAMTLQRSPLLAS
jgi:adenylate cyclase